MPGPSLTHPLPNPGPTPAATMTTPPEDRSTAGGGRLLWALLRPRRRALAAALAWSVIEALPALLSGSLIAAAADHGFLAGRPGVGLAWLGALALALLIKAAATRLMFPHLAAVTEPLRDDLVRAVVTATITRAATGTHPPDTAAVTRLTAQVDTVRNLVTALLRSSRALGMSLIAALAGLLVLSPPAAAIVAGPVTAALLVFAWLLRHLTARQRALVLADETLTTHATPILTGLRDVAACGAHDQAYATVQAAVDAQAAATRALAWAGTGRRLIVTLGAHLPLVILLLAAPSLTGGGHLSAGEVVGAVTYLVTGLSPALGALTGSVGAWGVTLAVTLHRLAQTITPTPMSPAAGSHPASPTAPARTPAPTPAPPRSAGADARPRPVAVRNGYDLRADRLGFAYAPQAAPIVRDLDLTVAEDEHLAVVGPSGIGKSTLSLLLTGLHPPTEGRIRLGGVPLTAIPEPELRAVLALVPQEAYVFTGTVRDNLAYLRPEPDAGPADTHLLDARLRAAATAVGADALITRLGGLDGVIDDPSALSAGERQLLALARVHASPARIVVLDEATCHLDPAAEAHAETAFAAREGTLVVIAHRISSALRAQRILLLDGTAALTGTHHDLIARSPLYADLVGHWQDHDHPATGG
ncbi:ABC transporter ATP-binding protein [Streptosporangium fragile]|uniref:ABC transporter ATP-binding protein n=1 Tax=Streptosporangium fragile TaxID=46186 RepID=A0ABP6IQQ2_9ACTN